MAGRTNGPLRPTSDDLNIKFMDESSADTSVNVLEDSSTPLNIPHDEDNSDADDVFTKPKSQTKHPKSGYGSLAACNGSKNLEPDPTPPSQKFEKFSNTDSPLANGESSSQGKSPTTKFFPTDLTSSPDSEQEKLLGKGDKLESPNYHGSFRDSLLKSQGQASAKKHDRIPSVTLETIPEKDFLQVPDADFFSAPKTRVLSFSDDVVSDHDPLVDHEVNSSPGEVGRFKVSKTVDDNTASAKLIPGGPGAELEFVIPPYRNRRTKNNFLSRHPGWKILKWNFNSKKEMTREEILKTYRLHFFVCLIFLVTVISVSLAWYYKNMATEQIYATQAIFFNPRSRELTLTDPNNRYKVHAKLGQDMPDWQLPLHCPIVMGDNPHVKECVWKNHAILRIVHFRDAHVQCYNVSWESLHAEHVPYDCFNIQDGTWYGPSNQSQSAYPIRGEYQLVPKNYTVMNNGIFSSVVDFYWLSSTGVGLYLQPDNPLQIVWGSSELCVLSNYTGPFYHQENSQTPPSLNYTLCNGVDPVKTNAFMQRMLVPRGAIKRPADKSFRGPYWALKNAGQDDAPGGQIEELVEKLVEFGFQDSKIVLDGSWEKHVGDLSFNPEKFVNLSDQLDVARLNGVDIIVPIGPYFELTSDNFYDGVTKSLFVLDAGGEVPGLTNFEGGIAAVLDVFNTNAVTWMENKTKMLSAALGLKNFRLTYGSKAWLPYKPYFSLPTGTPNKFRKAMTEMFDDPESPDSVLIVEHTSSSRHVPALIPVKTDVAMVEGRSCLVGAIETALTLGLMGYPFVLLEGVTPEARLSDELFLRWLQLAAIFPAHQYAAVPWNYGNDVINMATNVTSLHEQLVMAEMGKKYLIEEVESGLPILRPVWWLDPSNEKLHKLEIKDQFLIGNELLVAPVLCEGVTHRDVYFPAGHWVDPSGILSVGPKILLNQTVPRDTLLFYRKATVTE